MATALAGASVVEALEENFDTSAITRAPIDLSTIGDRDKDKIAFVLRNVLTPKECKTLISLSEAYQYVPAMINAADGVGIVAAGYRDGERVMIDDPEFVKILFQRIGHHLPQKFGDDWNLLRINERLRFLKYGVNGHFKPHRDSTYVRVPRSEMTFVTLQIYLNAGFGGGATTFLDAPTKIRVPVVPEPGMVLVFQHDILHEGSLVTSGTKYTIRSDVLYNFTEPEPKSWFDYLKLW